ncbi:MAG: bifunctional DNA-formamidopyrimidine glycosylase/DNA-(apurinic or apyrimidinic site) lyase [Chloroflexi bacterium]|nr:bifunctional DNA-formamidopyrimidine glycosylase/DNA-(apurinic or apyrimidinic site) lyase [Chloroflexota bacterium]MQC26996.1 bifunctional DNA-formamidopyrimidine glycosylase/DNA-(apurinic or apyrimidinic site) lyase [Chloroflexota bacterium]
MPELPEVETVARSLEAGQGTGSTILGRTIQRAAVAWNKTVAAPSATAFKKRIVGQQVTGVGRRAKFIRLDLSEDVLLVHLRMSGDLLFGRSDSPIGKYSRLQLYLDDGLQLSFDDARKFGRVWLVKDPEDVLGGLGPEPFDPALTPKAVHGLIHARKRQLKPLLLDQSFVAGLGNIYADEALHGARLHPLTSAHTISAKQSADLLAAIRAVLKEGIRRNGASIDWVYRGGDFQNHFKVYQRTGKPCPRCATPIERIVVGQRGTHFCPNCQIAPE